MKQIVRAEADTPDSYVIATGKIHTVRDLIEAVARSIDMSLHWEGEGQDEVGKDAQGNVRVFVDPRFYRPSESAPLSGDWSKAKEKLGWEPTVSFDDMIDMMVQSDLREIRRLQ